MPRRIAGWGFLVNTMDVGDLTLLPSVNAGQVLLASDIHEGSEAQRGSEASSKPLGSTLKPGPSY